MRRTQGTISNPSNIPGTGETSGGTWNIPTRSSDPVTQTTPTSTSSGTPNPATTIGDPVSFNANTYLYDVGLQNIFQDYQRNIATLNQQEQQSLQDAYYIREMSKKYLGQYASNVGVGDVSGNLLDIYGQYQQAVSGIRGQTNMAELGLQQQYDAQRRELELGRTMAEAEASQEPLGTWTTVTSPQTIDVRTGNPIENPFYDADFDIDYYNRPSDWQEGVSEVFVDGNGNYAYIGKDVEEEGFGGGTVFHDTITADWQTENEGTTLVAGMTHIYQGETFVLKEGKWYRLKSFGTSKTDSPQAIQQLMGEQEQNWSNPNRNYENISNKNIGFYQDKKDTNLYIINLESGEGKEKPLAYFVDVNKSALFETSSNTLGDTANKIIDKFKEVHGDTLKNETAVYYGGKLYFYKDGKVYEMERRSY